MELDRLDLVHALCQQIPDAGMHVVCYREGAYSNRTSGRWSRSGSCMSTELHDLSRRPARRYDVSCGGSRRSRAAVTVDSGGGAARTDASTASTRGDRAPYPFWQEKVERWVALQREPIEEALAPGREPEAMGELPVFEVRFAKMEVAGWGSEQIEALEEDEAIDEERFAWGKPREALAKEARGVKSRSARNSVVHAYEKVVKRHEGTVAARIAKERVEALGSN